MTKNGPDLSVSAFLVKFNSSNSSRLEAEIRIPPSHISTTSPSKVKKFTGTLYLRGRCYTTSFFFSAESGDYVDDRYHDDEELEEGEDQPLDFSAKKPEPKKITAKVMAVGPNDHHHLHGHFPTQSWAMPAASHSSESGVSDLCSNSPQSDNEPPMAPKSPLGGSPVSAQQSGLPRMAPQSPLPAALSAIYGPLAALQSHQQRNGGSGGIDPAITAATTQLLSNLAAVTNGGKGGKNTRPFKGKRHICCCTHVNGT